MSIELETDHSRSKSVVAAILLQSHRPSLTYQYRNEPHTQATVSMHAHRGTVWLNFERQKIKDVLSGDYYTGRDRRNTGTLTLDRERQTL